MPHGFDILFHRGVRRERSLRPLIRSFADLIVKERIVALPRPCYVEVMPVHLISGSPGWHCPRDVVTRREWIQLAGLDPKLAPPELLAEYPQDFGKGPWPFRFIRGFAHEIAHGLGADAERAAWRKGDAILSAALIRCPKLRRRIGTW